MLTSVASVGDAFDARCPQCAAVTRHAVTAMTAGRVTEAHCGACGWVRVFEVRPDPAAAASVPAQGPEPDGRPGQPGSAVAEAWEALLAGRDPDAAVPFGRGAPPGVGALLEHPHFGLGVVRKVLAADKIEVHFRAGIKRLRCPG